MKHSPRSVCQCYGILILVVVSNVGMGESKSPHCKAWLVQSIPTNMPHLSHVPGTLSTGDVLRWLAENSTTRLHIIAQYWELLPSPNDPRSGDYGYTQHQMHQFGAHQGVALYQALDAAADRNVSIRLLSHSGVYPTFTSEPSKLALGRPNVENVTLLLDHWWGSGIVHAKVWISDGRDVYIGSANNDWKSLTQVKELGIYFADCPEIAEKVEVYFDNLWTLASLNSSAYTKTVFDQDWQVERKVPCWSHFLDHRERCKSPLPLYLETPHVSGYPTLSDPFMFEVSFQTPGNNHSTQFPQASYLSLAPPELLFGKYQADEQAWIDTIKSVGRKETVRISTMDWLGQSEFTDQTIYWASLSSAISKVVFSKNATAQLLVAYWTHSISNTDVYLESLLYTNNLCSSSKYNTCSGKVEIKYYVVPGFNMTGPAIKGGSGNRTGNMYPNFTRVNHGKYAVSDVRAHIGTSNLVWDYFYTTAGVSFGTYNTAIISQLQEIFNADWNSPYAVPFEEMEKAHTRSSI